MYWSKLDGVLVRNPVSVLRQVTQVQLPRGVELLSKDQLPLQERYLGWALHAAPGRHQLPLLGVLQDALRRQAEICHGERSRLQFLLLS